MTTTDALSDVLRSIRLSGGLFFRVRARAPFAVSALPTEQVRRKYAPGADHVLPFHVVTSGAIWFSVEGAEPARLEAEDIIVLPRGAAHQLSDAPGRAPVPVEALEDRIAGRPPTLEYGGDGPGSEALCGFFAARSRLFNPLIDALPAVVTIAGAERRAWMVDTFRKAFAEMASDRPGRHAMVERLTESLFLDVVQTLLEDRAPPGWLGGLKEPLVARALDALHADPGRAWDVASLARAVGASRSVLAERFRATVGLSPMRYLAAWRIERAADLLLTSRDGVADIAARVGYDSQSAFNRAFKRHTGESPSRWRQNARRDPPS